MGGDTATQQQAYGEPWYWDERYANESGPFDWYQKYQSLAPIVNLYVPRRRRHHHILVVGCGNSAFSEGMADDGHEDVVSIDISSVVIQAMQTKYSNRTDLKFLQMDVRDMSDFQTASFDAVIDKGTLDSLLCGSNSKQNAAQMLDEVWRVLKDKGVYILVTYGAPLYRLRLLKESSSWVIKLHVIDKLRAEHGTGWDGIEVIPRPVPVVTCGTGSGRALHFESKSRRAQSHMGRDGIGTEWVQSHHKIGNKKEEKFAYIHKSQHVSMI